MKEKKIPMRKCVGCMNSKAKNELIRIAGYEGEITVDVTGKAKGRGVYICRSEECLKMAFKRKAFGRGLSIEVSPETEEKLKADLEEVLYGEA